MIGSFGGDGGRFFGVLTADESSHLNGIKRSNRRGNETRGDIRSSKESNIVVVVVSR
ncbi:hypothetical protein Hanom_Chr11g01008131 [Helianthus anomalus]